MRDSAFPLARELLAPKLKIQGENDIFMMGSRQVPEPGRGDGAWGRIRTTDTRIFNPLLYQLSYPGKPSARARGGL